jgi:Trypsin
LISYFGIYDLKQRDSPGWELEAIFLHEDWRSADESFDADVALLKMSKLIAFTDAIKPICLWPMVDWPVNGTVISWTEPEPDDPGFWNHDRDPLHNFPQQYVMPIRSDAECFSSQPRFKMIASERSFCAGGLNSGPCLELGTSGASMAVQVDGRFYLRGIVSASFIDIAGCDNVTFTLFTDVLKFKAWMIDTMTGRDRQ